MVAQNFFELNFITLQVKLNYNCNKVQGLHVQLQKLRPNLVRALNFRICTTILGAEFIRGKT